MKRYKIKRDIDNKKKKKAIFGRKRAGSREKGAHNKFSYDNLRRKAKFLIIDSLMDFINLTIKIIYKGNIGHGILIKRFFTMGYEQIKNSIIEYNKEFLNKTLGDIFSEDISTRYTNYPPDHNKNLIMRLTNENNKDIKKFFTGIFNIMFKEVIRHINGTEIIYELNGLKGIDEIVKRYEDEPKYYHKIKEYILNFDNIIEKNKSRKRNISNKKK